MKKLEKLRVIDLPTPLINLIGRQLGFDVSDVERSASEALSKIDWSRSIGEERLAYAELKYQKGTKIVSTMGTCGIIKKLNKAWEGNRGCLYIDGHSDEIGDIVLEVWNREKWAEIIEESGDILFSDGCTDEDKEKIREMIKQVEPKRQREEPTFKEGDMVDYIPCSLRNERSWRSRVRFTGGMTSDGEYVIEFQNKTVGLASEIRKHKPSIDEDDDQSLPDHVVKFRIEEIESKMDYLMESIEALKKGKRL